MTPPRKDQKKFIRLLLLQHHLAPTPGTQRQQSHEFVFSATPQMRTWIKGEHFVFHTPPVLFLNNAHKLEACTLLCNCL